MFAIFMKVGLGRLLWEEASTHKVGRHILVGILIAIRNGLKVNWLFGSRV